MEITKVSGLLDLLDSGDAVMADKGFIIGSVLADHGVDLYYTFSCLVVNLHQRRFRKMML